MSARTHTAGRPLTGSGPAACIYLRQAARPLPAATALCIGWLAGVASMEEYDATGARPTL